MYIITYIHNIENTDTHVYTTVHVYIEYKFVDTITVLQNYIITYDKICNLVIGLFYVHNIYTVFCKLNDMNSLICFWYP